MANKNVSSDLPAELHHMSSRCSISSHCHTPNVEIIPNIIPAFVVEVIGGFGGLVHVIIQAAGVST